MGHLIRSTYLWANDQLKFDLVYLEEHSTTLMFVYHQYHQERENNELSTGLEEKRAFQGLTEKTLGASEMVYRPAENQLVAVWNFPAHWNKTKVKRVHSYSLPRKKKKRNPKKREALE